MMNHMQSAQKKKQETELYLKYASKSNCCNELKSSNTTMSQPSPTPPPKKKKTLQKTAQTAGQGGTHEVKMPSSRHKSKAQKAMVKSGSTSTDSSRLFSNEQFLMVSVGSAWRKLMYQSFGDRDSRICRRQIPGKPLEKSIPPYLKAS